MESASQPKPLTFEQIAAHPGTANVIAPDTPTTQGFAPVANGRAGGPLNIAYEIYGTGPIRLVWITGLSAPKIAWHRQVKYFAVRYGDRFSCLIFDHRGIGDSDTPFTRYSTSEMAKDTLELCNHVGWTGARGIHVVGVSMGGMIAQELAYCAPERLASLTLQSTAAQLLPANPYFKHLLDRLYLIMPKPAEQGIASKAHRLFSGEWLAKPDTLGVFPTNLDRFTAEELWRQKNLRRPVWFAWFLQAIATSWHQMGADRLKKLGEGVKNVLVCTGNQDNMVHWSHSETLVAGIRTGGAAVDLRVFEGCGHALNRETVDEYHTMLEAFVVKAEEAAAKERA